MLRLVWRVLCHQFSDIFLSGYLPVIKVQNSCPTQIIPLMLCMNKAWAMFYVNIHKWTLDFQLPSYWQVSNSPFLKKLMHFEKLWKAIILAICLSIIFTIWPPKSTIKRENVSGCTFPTEMCQHFSVSHFQRKWARLNPFLCIEDPFVLLNKISRHLIEYNPGQVCNNRGFFLIKFTIILTDTSWKRSII